MQFDPKAAKAEFSRKEAEELVRIAFLEPDYLQEARSLAEQELAKRGIAGADRQLIVKRLKEDMQDAETERWENASFAYEIPSPLLNLTFAQKRWISAILGVLPAIAVASVKLGWNLFFGYDRWVAVASFFAFMVFVHRVGPSGKELREHFTRKKKPELGDITAHDDSD
jgi:hypothetical protein